MNRLNVPSTLRPCFLPNLILNSPCDAPRWHFKLNDAGITDEIEEKPCPSSYFIPITSPMKEGFFDHRVLGARYSSEGLRTKHATFFWEPVVCWGYDGGHEYGSG